MYLKLALGNVRRSLKDYSVFFATLAFAACLLYSFSASGDYLAAMALTERQRATLGSQQLNTVMSAFSVFVVIVFAFLVSYGFRFILRRRKREFALYVILGMDGPHVSRILRYEGFLVGAASFAAGVAAGVVFSPYFMLLEAYVFGVAWAPALVFSTGSFLWTLGCFAALVAVACVSSGRVVSRSTPAALFSADRRPERLLGEGRPWAQRLQLVGGAVLVAAVWATVLLQPGMFLAMLLPFGLVALAGTYLLFRSLAHCVPAWLRRHPRRYLSGLTCFTVRQVEAKASSSAMAMAMVCVLLACGVCMVVAGLAFSVGIRDGVAPGAGISDPFTWAPIGFIGLFYGIAFLLSAMAVLALQQLSEAADSAIRYRVLADLGADDAMMGRSLRSQLAVYFGVPLAGALLHDAVGLTLIALLAMGVGAGGFGAMAGATVAGVVVFMALYYAVTYAECRRILFAGRAARRKV